MLFKKNIKILILIGLINFNLNADTLSNFDSEIFEYIKKEKIKFSNTQLNLDNKLTNYAKKRNNYLEKNNKQLDKDFTETNKNDSNFQGFSIVERTKTNINEKNKVINEIIFIKNKSTEKTIKNILSNPYYKSTLLNPLYNKIGINSNERFITIYLSSSYFDKICSLNYILPEYTDVDKSICVNGSSFAGFNDPLNFYDKIENMERDFFHDQTIFSSPNNNENDVNIYSYNILNFKYIKNKDLIGNPILIEFKYPIPVETYDNKVFDISFKLYKISKKEKKEVKTILIERTNNSIKNEYLNIKNSNYPNDETQFNMNFIGKNQYVLLPLNMLEYNSDYIIEINFAKNKWYDDYINEKDNPTIIKNIPTFQNWNKTIKFSTQKIGNKDSKIIYLDDYQNNNFELSKNTDYIFVSSDFYETDYKCSNIENKIEQLNINSIKISPTKDDVCTITNYLNKKSYKFNIK